MNIYKKCEFIPYVFARRILINLLLMLRWLKQTDGDRLTMPFLFRWTSLMQWCFAPAILLFLKFSWKSLCIHYKIFKIDTELNTFCSFLKFRALIIGGDKFQSSSKALRILQVSWHPYSDTHLGVLSSDGVFRFGDDH